MTETCESINSGFSVFDSLMEKASSKMYDKRIIPYLNKYGSKYLKDVNSVFTNLLVNFSSPKTDNLTLSNNEPVN